MVYTPNQVCGRKHYTKEYVLTSEFDATRRGRVEDLTSDEVMEFDISRALTTEEAIEYLAGLPKPYTRKIKFRTLEVYRSKGRGPMYYMDADSGAIRYAEEDLYIWAKNVCKKSHVPFDVTRALRVIPNDAMWVENYGSEEYNEKAKADALAAINKAKDE